MDGKDQDARNRIIKAAQEILNETADIEKITIRQVAGRAKVGTGLINYHFKSKDNLLSIAIGDIMAEMARDYGATVNSIQEPVQKLKTMLKKLYSFGEHHQKLLQFTLAHGILHGDMQAALFIVPVLKEIYGKRMDEMNLRIMALQILLPIQVTGVSPSAFHIYSGVDLRNETQRNNFIDTLIDNLVKR